MTVSGVIGEAFVEIRPELSKLFDETNKGVSEAVDKAGKEQSSSFDKVAKVGQAAFVGLSAAAVGFGAIAVKEALEGEKAHALLVASVKAAGGSMEALEPAIDRLTTKFAKLGFTNDELEQGLARMTQITQDPTKALDLMGVTADLARARHIGLEQAATLVGRAAEGNVTPLKRMGIEIATTGNAATDGKAAIDELQKRFGGAAQAEADTYSGKLAAFRATVSNLEESIGNALLPVLGKAATALSDTVTWFEHNRTAAELLGIAVGGPLVIAMSTYIIQQGIAIGLKVADFFETAAIAALYAADGIKGAALAAKDFAVSVAAFVGPVELAAAAVGLLTGAISFDTVHTKDAKDAAKLYVDQLKGSGDEVSILKDRIGTMSKARDDEFLATERAAVAHGNWADVSRGARAQYDKETAAIVVLKDRVKELTTQHQAATTAHEDLTAAQEKAGVSTEDLAKKTGLTTDVVGQLADKLKIDLTKATDDQIASLEALAARLHETNPETLALRDAIGKYGDKTADATEKSKAFKTALDLLIGGQVDATKAVVVFEGAIDGLGEKIRINASSLDAHTKAGRDNISAIDDAVVAIRSHIEALQAQGASADALQGALAGDTNELRKQLEQTGLTKDQIDALIQSYGLVPSSINTIVSADLSQAVAALENLSGKALAAEHLTTTVTRSVGGAPVVRMAAGGILTGPQFLLAGEAGPEVVLPLSDPARMAQLLGEASRRGLISGSSSGPTSTAGDGPVSVTVEAHFYGPTSSDDMTRAMRSIAQGELAQWARDFLSARRAGAGRL